jgi:deoxyribose-phosphate aldolase
MPTLPQSRPKPLKFTVANRNQAVRCLDLTTLAGDDTSDRVKALCEKAMNPIDADITVAAVCVFPVFVKFAKGILEGSGVKVVTVAAGFPHGLSTLRSRLDEIKQCVELGVDEIDVVIRRSFVLEGRVWDLMDEVRAMRGKAGTTCMKIILSTSELGAPESVYNAAFASIKAGANFIKSSTGKEASYATLEDGEVMCAAISKSGKKVGIKPAGGIRTAKDAMAWMALVKERLGEEWLTPALFRIGASSLLDDLAQAATVD